MIGAGAAGLAAAWTLRQAGHEVVVLERRPVVGGLLASAERAGVLADTAVQLLSSTYRETFALARAAAVASALQPTAGHDSLWRRGRPHGITYGSVPSMLASGAMPTLLKLKLGAKYVPWLTTRGSHIDANDLAGTAVAEDRESIAEWGRRELGEDFVEYLTYPLLAAYYGTPPEEVSAALYHGLARVGMDVELFAMRGGAASFAAALAGALERAGGTVRSGFEVANVEAGEQGVRVHGAGGAEEFEGVIVATPPAHAGRIVADERIRAWLAPVRTRPAVSVTLWLRQRAAVKSFGYSFPRQEQPGDVVVAACVQSQKLAFGADAHGDAIVAFPAPAYLDGNPDNATLQAAIPAALERALPGLARVLDAVEVNRLDGGYRTFAPGHIRRLAEDPPPRAARLVLAGDYLVAPTVEGAVRSGIRAARELIGP